MIITMFTDKLILEELRSLSNNSQLEEVKLKVKALKPASNGHFIICYATSSLVELNNTLILTSPYSIL